MMERDQRAERALCIAVAKDLERAACTVIRANVRSFLDGSDEIWIESETGSSKRHQGNRGGIVWRRRKHARRRPGRFVHHFLAVEHRNAQISPRQLKSNRAANDTAPHDDNVVRFHDINLSSKSAGRDCTGRVYFSDFTSSLERTPAFSARFCARTQSPAIIASWAWLRKPLIFSTKSFWAALGLGCLPLASCRLSSAVLIFDLVLLCAAARSLGESCGEI